MGNNFLTKVVGTEIQRDSVAFWNLGQAGILIKGRSDDGLVCVDPYLTASIEDTDPNSEFKRAFPPIMEPEMLACADGILLTHAHGDHLDIETISGIAKASQQTQFAVPAPDEGLLGGIVSPEKLVSVRGQERFYLKNFKVTPVPAAHTEYEVDANGSHFYFGYFLDVNGIRIYHSGDTVVTPMLLEQVRAFQPHIAFLPINGRDPFRTSRGIVGNINFREAVDFAVSVGADMFVPIHYDLFPNNRENPAYMVDYLFQQYPFQKFHMMAPGERFIYYK